MFGIGSTEFLVILLVALLVLGPRNLAKVSKTVGKYMGEFRRVSTDFQRTLNAEVAEEERQESREAVRKKVAAARAARARKVTTEQAAQGGAAAATAAATAAAAGQPLQQAQAEPAPAGVPVVEATVADASETRQAPDARRPAVTVAGTEETLAPPPAGSPLEAMLRKTAAEAASAPATPGPATMAQADETRTGRQA